MVKNSVAEENKVKDGIVTDDEANAKLLQDKAAVPSP
jgi:hypothetical protein